MSEFVVVATLLCALALAFALMPLVVHRRTRQQQQQRSEANVLAFEQRLAELTQECEQGAYSAEEFEALKADLQHRLLDDVPEQIKANTSSMPLWPWVLGLLLALPLAAWSLYQHTGAQAEIAIIEQMQRVEQASDEAQLQQQASQLVSQLQQQLADNPDQPHHWMLLARTQMRLQQYAAAEQSFKSVLDVAGEAPVVMGLYAQARYMAQGRQLDAVSQRIAERALELQPNNGTVLGMMGMASFEQQNFPQAVHYWRRLLTLLDPQSPTAKMIQQGVEQANAMIPEQDGQQERQQVEQAVSSGPVIMVKVSIAATLHAASDAPVFIYARAINGPKMPLAVARLTVADLPTTVRLDESMAMAPGMSLSKFAQVEVVARISSQGIANAAAGDLQGLVGPVDSAGEAVVELVIDEVLE
ncbi:c-type cytochrome biogenesis protein CcmI [Dasania marina]|uniref:c-type cytochrome biogenesis protein CcmI n=1 Tax=Dasania marina TaxID=471499 RepID=UPI00035DA4D4|nr:c-type cytochrome biogenesis protein CcmI [Dasania marina]